MVNRAMMQLLALVKKFMHTAHRELGIRVFMLMEYHNENRKGSVAKCVIGLSKYKCNTFFAILYCNCIVSSMPQSILYSLSNVFVSYSIGINI